MTDLTSTLSNILVKNHGLPPLAEDVAHLSRSLDSFLTEAYQINASISSLLSYLRAIRQPYLSLAPPPRRTPAHKSKSSFELKSHKLEALGEVPNHLTDPQREQIDSQTSALLRDVNNNITNLTTAVQVQHDTSQKVLERKYGKPNNILWRWAAGDADTEGGIPDAGKSDQQLREEGEVRSRQMFREGVLWYLNWALKGVVGVQQEMVGIRLEREREKKASTLRDESNRNVRLERSGTESEGVDSWNQSTRFQTMDMRGKDEYNPALDPSYQNSGQNPDLTPEQLQLFEEENSSLLNHYNDTLAKVTQTEKSLLEISSLQQTLVGHLSVQGEMIGQLVADAERTDENVRKGNQELKRASERGSTARMVFVGTVSLCGFLVVWDLIF